MMNGEYIFNSARQPFYLKLPEMFIEDDAFTPKLCLLISFGAGTLFLLPPHVSSSLDLIQYYQNFSIKE